MKPDAFFLTLDIGTSSMKAGLFDRDYRLVRTEKLDYAFSNTGAAGSIDPETIWQAFLSIARRLGPDVRRVGGVAQCTLSPSLVLMDEGGRALAPSILHWDRRSVREAREAIAVIGRQRFLEQTGNIPYPGSISLTSLLWIKRREPEVFRKCFKIGHMNTYFLRRLTGEWAIDPTNASLTGLYDTIHRGGWIGDFCGELDIPMGVLPPIVECIEWAGKVTPEAARESGLPSGTPVLMGSNDTSSACLGAGVTEPGQILNISGSAELLAVCLGRPAPDEKRHLRVHPLPGRWIAFTIMASGFALEWCRTQLFREMDETAFYGPYLGSLLAQDRRSTVRFAPYLCGDRTSLSQKWGSFSGLKLETTRDDLAYAIIESTSGRVRADLRRMSTVAPLDAVIHLTGGRADTALAAYKERRFRGYRFETRENCALLGCAEIFRLAGKK